MCIIAVCRDRKLTDLEIWYCWINNPDGAGFAWAEKNHHTFSKGYMKYNEFLAAYQQINIFPHVVHFRTSSSGAIIPELTHPFVCSEIVPTNIEWTGKESLLFHNGVIVGWEMMARLFGIDPLDPNWSDTRLLSLILSNYTFENIVEPEKKGRFVILSDGIFRVSGEFEDHNGILFSNTGYKETLYYEYYVVTPEGNKHKYRKKKSRNIQHHGNGPKAKSWGPEQPGHNRNYSQYVI